MNFEGKQKVLNEFLAFKAPERFRKLKTEKVWELAKEIETACYYIHDRETRETITEALFKLCIMCGATKDEESGDKIEDCFIDEVLKDGK